jgi:glycosyltransferase involved in cell wall biosynthesis
MMLGKPIIVARGTNADQIVEKEDMGLVVEYGNASNLESALEKLANDPGERQRLGRNARRAYENTYSWGLMKQRLTTYYNSLVHECGLR